jgi:uncharacterized protein (DUF1697 family)
VTTYVALLRAINLAGINRVGMADLRQCLAGAGMEDVRTLLQSGNVVCRSDVRSPARLETIMKDVAKRELGVETEFFVRSAAEWGAVIDGNPFPNEAKTDPGRLIVTALRDPPAAEQLAALRAAIRGREVVEVNGRHAYIVYPDGMGRSKLTMALLERRLATRGTARNWNTVLKLGALAGASR